MPQKDRAYHTVTVGCSDVEHAARVDRQSANAADHMRTRGDAPAERLAALVAVA
jgi:hypothetical protein